MTRSLIPAVVAVVGMLVAGVPRPFVAEASAAKPNLLFILTDDQRPDTLGVMPSTRESFPAVFTEAIATTPLCCPSRSSFLTGEYAHDTGVHTNDGYSVFRSREPDSLGPWLRALGYRTGFVGKYFNRYTVNDPVPPGWDEFYAELWDENRIRYGDGYSTFALREFEGTGQGQVVEYPNLTDPDAYSTIRFAELAERFVRRSENSTWNSDGKPWALLVWTNAPNGRIPEPKYSTASVPAWTRPPSFLEADLTDKPFEVLTGPNRNEDPADHRQTRILQHRLLLSVDDLVDRLFDTLDALGLRGETWGVFASDNGRLWGEHRLERKLYGYEESIRIPLRVASPGTSSAAVIDKLVANIDVAPTLIELAGGDTGGHDFDGRSILGLLDGTATSWRGTILIEHWARVVYQGVRTERWKYIRWLSGNKELYDLHADPFELENLARDRRRVVDRMNERLRRLKNS